MRRLAKHVVFDRKVVYLGMKNKLYIILDSEMSEHAL